MKLSKQTQYGLQILLQLAAKAHTKQLATGKQIARIQNINEPYVEQIIAPLKRGGLVQTVRGRHGGYALGKDAGDITVLEIIETFEGTLELAHDDIRSKSPGASDIWARLTSDLRDAAEQVTLAAIQAENAAKTDYII